MGCRCAGGLLLAMGAVRSARAADGGAAGWPTTPLSLSQVPAEPATAGPTSLGQQPAPVPTTGPRPTPAQRGNPQLNQLFGFEATPNICAAGEGYLSGQFNLLEREDTFRQYRFQLQGQYGITDQIAVGAFVPVIYNQGLGFFDGDDFTGVGDIGIYGQYKFDKLIDPDLFSLTAHVSVVLPTGDRYESRDRGHFGVRPLALAYKDFGVLGPGRLGAYGLLGFTASEDADLRFGLAATYEIAHVVAALELGGAGGSPPDGPGITLTPGVIYRGVDGFEFLLGVPIGVSNAAPDYGVTLKVTYGFAR